jgi:hypothetical protein
MSSQDETIIEFSPAKTALGVIGCLAFIGAGIWMLTLDPAQVASGKSFRLFLNSPIFARVLGVITIVVFGGLGAMMVSRLLSKKAGIILNSEGITDHASSAAAGFIPWSDVIGMEVFEISGQKSLIILVSDPQKYLERGNPVKRKLNSANMNMCGSPISISSHTLKVDFDELLSTFDLYLKKYATPQKEG